MQTIKISYDGRVYASKASVFLGDHSLTEIISIALGINDNDFHNINAEIEINIYPKPNAPTVWIEGDDEC